MDEKKEYSVIGTVTIGTDEYRDLIEDKFKAEQSKDFYMRESWKKDDKIKTMQEENNKLKQDLEALKKFIQKKNSNNDESISLELFTRIVGE